MIEDVNVTAARCDACGRTDYSDSQGGFLGGRGYALTIAEHETDTQHEAYACKETHIGKAVRAVLDQWRTGTPDERARRGTPAAKPAKLATVKTASER